MAPWRRSEASRSGKRRSDRCFTASAGEHRGDTAIYATQFLYRRVLSVCVSFSSFRFNPDIIGTLEEYVSFQVTVSINSRYKVVY